MIQAGSKLFLPLQPHGSDAAISCSIWDWSTLKAAPLATDLIDLESLQLLSGQEYILTFHVKGALKKNLRAKQAPSAYTKTLNS